MLVKKNSMDFQLTPTSKRMFELEDAVMTEWKINIIASIKKLHRFRDPIAANTFSELYRYITKCMTYGFQLQDTTVPFEFAEVHGKRRALLAGFNVSELITEYQVFRTTMFDVLKFNYLPLEYLQIRSIHTCIDHAINRAVCAFARTQSACTEHIAVSVIHDLRNPLTAASTAAELIGYTNEIEKTHELACVISSNISRIEEMTRTMLDSMVFPGKSKTSKPTFFNINDVITEVVQQYVLSHQANIEVSTKPIKGWWKRGAIKRAVENLIDNAVKYGDLGRPIQVKVYADIRHLILSVHNEGPPIPEKNQETIFQIFQRIKASKSGTSDGWGIGLPNVRSIVQSHGGEVFVKSSQEVGTTFSITLPIDARPAFSKITNIPIQDDQAP